MAKYGAFVYGNTKYGTGSAGTQPTFTGANVWMIGIAWTGGLFTNEAARTIDYQLTRGRRAYLSPNGTTFETMQPGQLTIVLDNYDGRYDPYNTNSPLYGNIKPGREVCCKVKVVGDQTYARFVGRISDIRPAADNRTVTITCLDYLRWLYDQDISVAEKQNIKASSAINYVLDAAEYPYPRSIDSSYHPIYIFDPSESNALAAIQEITDASLGTFFVTADGIARYQDVKAFGGKTVIVNQSSTLKEIVVAQPWETVRNKIKVSASRRGMGGTPSVIWSYGQPLLMPGNTSPITIDVTYEAAKPIQPSYWSQDFTVAATPDGGALSFWGQYNIVVTLSKVTKTGCTITVSSSSSTPIYVLGLRLRGYIYADKVVKFEANNASSIAEYGPRRFNLDSPWLQDRAFATVYSQALVSFLANSSKAPIIHIENVQNLQYNVDLLDRINLVAAKIGIDASYDIGGIEERWNESTGQSVTTTFYLQNVLYYDTSGITPDPYYPEVPPIPPDPDPNPIPPTPGRDPKCTQAIYYMATGPYALGSGQIDNSLAQTVQIPVHYWFRPLSEPLHSYLEITGKFEKLSGGAWVEMANSDWTISAYNEYGQFMCSGTVTGSGNTRTVEFPVSNDSAVRRVDSFVIDFLSTGSSSPQKTVTGPGSTVTVQGSLSGATQFTNLTPGQWYMIQSSGGPWYAGAGGTSPSYCANFSFSNFSYVYNNSDITVFGADALGVMQNNVFGNPNCYIDPIYPYAMFWFLATSDKGYVCCSDSPLAEYNNNSGSMQLTIFPARVTNDGSKRILVDSMNLYNVCEIL